MKKFVMIVLVALLTIGVVFASEEKRWSIGATFGTASMNEITFNSGDLKVKNGNLGIGANVKVDYELVQDVSITGIVGWQMPDRNFIVKDPTYLTTSNERKQHYITVLAGATVSNLKSKTEKNDGETTATDIIWSATAGPIGAVNVTKGRFGGGVGALIKGSYFLTNDVSLDLGVDVNLIGIKDSPSDNKVHWFCDYGVKLGCAYRFK